MLEIGCCNCCSKLIGALARTSSKSSINSYMRTIRQSFWLRPFVVVVVVVIADTSPPPLCDSFNAIQLAPPPVGLGKAKSPVLAFRDEDELVMGTSVSGTRCGVRLEMGGNIGLAGH